MRNVTTINFHIGTGRVYKNDYYPLFGESNGEVTPVLLIRGGYEPVSVFIVGDQKEASRIKQECGAVTSGVMRCELSKLDAMFGAYVLRVVDVVSKDFAKHSSIHREGCVIR